MLSVLQKMASCVARRALDDEKRTVSPYKEIVTHCWEHFVQGTDVTDEELLEYISESSTMSKAMDEYDGEYTPHSTGENCISL